MGREVGGVFVKNLVLSDCQHCGGVDLFDCFIELDKMLYFLQVAFDFFLEGLSGRYGFVL